MTLGGTASDSCNGVAVLSMHIRLGDRKCSMSWVCTQDVERNVRRIA